MRHVFAAVLIAFALSFAPAWADEPMSPKVAGVAVDYDQSIERLFDASLHALHVLKIPVERRDADAYTAAIVARRGTGSARVHVTITRTGPMASRAAVSSSDHDDALVSLVHEKIAAALR